MAVIKAEIEVELRAIKLGNKPDEMLNASPKGTVPVLVLPQRFKEKPIVIEESLEVMLWALAQNDPHQILPDKSRLLDMLDKIARFEAAFVPALDAYKQAKRYHEDGVVDKREVCEALLSPIDTALNKHSYINGTEESLIDIALVPLIRKFSKVEKAWFRQSPYLALQRWLNRYIQSPLFSHTMQQTELWLPNKPTIIFGRR